VLIYINITTKALSLYIITLPNRTIVAWFPWFPEVSIENNLS
jgi:hypothetical protein